MDGKLLTSYKSGEMLPEDSGYVVSLFRAPITVAKVVIRFGAGAKCDLCGSYLKQILVAEAPEHPQGPAVGGGWLGLGFRV